MYTVKVVVSKTWCVIDPLLLLATNWKCHIVCRFVPFTATLNVLEGYSSIAGFFECNSTKIWATLRTVSTDTARRAVPRRQLSALFIRRTTISNVLNVSILNVRKKQVLREVASSVGGCSRKAKLYSHGPTRRDATRQFCRVRSGAVEWALCPIHTARQTRQDSPVCVVSGGVNLPIAINAFRLQISRRRQSWVVGNPVHSAEADATQTRQFCRAECL